MMVQTAEPASGGHACSPPSASAAVFGIDAYDVCVEVDVAQGLPHWTLVGLPAGEVKESRERVSAALANSGFVLPPRRITVSLSPGDLRKAGTGFDLPIAIALLVALGALSADSVANLTLLGELGLDGAVRGVRGVLSVARHLSTKSDVRAVVVPPANVNEAALVRSLRCGAYELRELVDMLRDGTLVDAKATAREASTDDGADFADVVGQPAAKRALEIAAPAGTTCCSSGRRVQERRCSRGVCRRSCRVTDERRLEVTTIHSRRGTLRRARVLASGRFARRITRSRTAGLVGGGWPTTPGRGRVSRITACCFSTSCRISARVRSRRSGSPGRRPRRRSRARR